VLFADTNLNGETGRSQALLEGASLDLVAPAFDRVVVVEWSLLSFDLRDQGAISFR